MTKLPFVTFGQAVEYLQLVNGQGIERVLAMLTNQGEGEYYELAQGAPEAVTFDVDALLRKAIATGSDVFLVHNHPDNSLTPSMADIVVTGAIYRHYQRYNVKLIDHVIVSDDTWLSLKEFYPDCFE